ncbi:MAG: hypothetical protein ACREBS_02815 [Nitrososphaerales archaeon]
MKTTKRRVVSGTLTSFLIVQNHERDSSPYPESKATFSCGVDALQGFLVMSI